MLTAPAEVMNQLDADLKSDPARTENLDAVYQFVLTGATGGEWWIEAANGTGTVQAGSRQDVNATVRMTDEVFLQMSSGELDGDEAYMDGLLTVEGEQSKAMYLAQIFGQ